MGAFVARNDNFIAGLDVILSRIGGRDQFYMTRRARCLAITPNLTLTQAIVTAFGGLRIPLGPPNLELYGTLGVRYFHSRTALDLSFPATGCSSRSFALTKDWADPVAGLRGALRHQRQMVHQFPGGYGRPEPTARPARRWAQSATIGRRRSRRRSAIASFTPTYATSAGPCPISAINPGSTGRLPASNIASDPNRLRLSPGLKRAGHALHKCGAPGGGGEIHVVKGQILEPALRIDQRADVVMDETVRGIVLRGDVANGSRHRRRPPPSA